MNILPLSRKYIVKYGSFHLFIAWFDPMSVGESYGPFHLNAYQSTIRCQPFDFLGEGLMNSCHTRFFPYALDFFLIINRLFLFTWGCMGFVLPRLACWIFF